MQNSPPRLSWWDRADPSSDVRGPHKESEWRWLFRSQTDCRHETRTDRRVRFRGYDQTGHSDLSWSRVEPRHQFPSKLWCFNFYVNLQCFYNYNRIPYTYFKIPYNYNIIPYTYPIIPYIYHKYPTTTIEYPILILKTYL